MNKASNSAPSIVVVGASLGGIDALSILLGGLDAAFAAPVVVVIHRRPDPDSGLESLLALRSALPLLEVSDPERLKPGVVYLAPPGYHVLVEPKRLVLTVDAPVNYARPSIDALFESAADTHAAGVVSILLTCSSVDGAAGTARVAARGGTTIVQDPMEAESAVAPEAALALTEVDHVARLGAMPGILRSLMETRR